jgi:hypothetical protein
MKAGPLVVTVDLDWACETATAELLGYLREADVPATVFTTHRSAYVLDRLDHLEVGLHPHFGPGSSHGSTIDEVVGEVTQLPHNISAYRCHRFAISNEIRLAMRQAGMKISSNVCTDVEVLSPFRERGGSLELPVFLEDGGYLHSGRPMDDLSALASKLQDPLPKVLLFHPMHFAVNTPRFEYMADIKRSVTPGEWNAMSPGALASLRWPGCGVRDLVVGLLALGRRHGLNFATVAELAHTYGSANEGPRFAHGSARARRA